MFVVVLYWINPLTSPFSVRFRTLYWINPIECAENASKMLISPSILETSSIGTRFSAGSEAMLDKSILGKEFVLAAKLYWIIQHSNLHLLLRHRYG
ncbi:hypothetical protein [Paenibacillus selenitireducens]|uniref:hypothetical protein n=1 Tax=Paenibacillus selenitireducens TaxID=1324314 RepID=UPI00117C2748|nr:hypothetical protein [Paenibacillus selenitireducens]